MRLSSKSRSALPHIQVFSKCIDLIDTGTWTSWVQDADTEFVEVLATVQTLHHLFESRIEALSMDGYPFAPLHHAWYYTRYSAFNGGCSLEREVSSLIEVAQSLPVDYLADTD